jgi:alpha-beta hydrolase superfamily lysophospholipase
MSEQLLLQSHSIADLPYLMLAADDAPTDAPIAVILHGLGRHKESTLPILYAFARRGLRAIALDARLHGLRSGHDMREQRLQSDYLGTMAEIFEGTTQDLSRLLDALGVSRAAIHGVSLGGYIAFAAMADDSRFAVGAMAIGSPDWLEALRAGGMTPGNPIYDAVAARSPLERASVFPPRPLLMLHGDQDATVSVQGVQAMQRALVPLYQDFPERLQLIVYPGLDHAYTDEMLERSADWCAHYLKLK